MIAGIFHAGSGLGNQLHRYVGTKILALESQHEHGMVAPELFKGHSFMELDMGKPLDCEYIVEEPSGKVVANIETFDGEFQGEEDFMYHVDEVREWLAVEPLEMSENLCVINFRGGEYVGVRDLFLPQEYWDRAIGIIREKYPAIEFEVHTDDVWTASQFFPDFPIIKDIGINWRSIRYAKHLILSNSSFAILPALLNEEVKEIIAPMYWAGYNEGQWKLPQNNYRKFTYI